MLITVPAADQRTEVGNEGRAPEDSTECEDGCERLGRVCYRTYIEDGAAAHRSPADGRLAVHGPHVCGPSDSSLPARKRAR
jgi:hypothetical protein